MTEIDRRRAARDCATRPVGNCSARQLAQLSTKPAGSDEPILDRVAVVDERVVVDRLLERVGLPT
jgi:hypothetical protein